MHLVTQETFAGRQGRPVAGTVTEAEPALGVVLVYQDPLTRHWAAELWDRVGKLIDRGGIISKSWKLSEMSSSAMLPAAVEAAAAADVLVISVRDGGNLPLLLQVWIDGWVPRRVEPVGTLVALIGVPAGPHTISSGAYEYLETIARQAGLDFLPRERKLPEQSLVPATLPRIATATGLTANWLGAEPSPSTGVSLGWRLS